VSSETGSIPVKLILSLINRQLQYQPTNFDLHRPHCRTRPHRLPKTQWSPRLTSTRTASGLAPPNLEPPLEESRAPIAEPLSVPAVHDASLTTPPRRIPFKNRPPWAIRKPADEIMAPFDQHEAPTRHARDTLNTAIAHSPLPEIADSIDGRAVNDVTDKHSSPLDVRRLRRG